MHTLVLWTKSDDDEQLVSSGSTSCIRYHCVNIGYPYFVNYKLDTLLFSLKFVCFPLCLYQPSRGQWVAYRCNLGSLGDLSSDVGICDFGATLGMSYS